MDFLSKRIRIALLSLVSVILIIFCLTQDQNKWYVAGDDLETLKEIDINVSVLPDCKLNVCVKNRSSIPYNYLYSVEKLCDSTWMYWAEDALRGECRTPGTLMGRVFKANSESYFEVDLRDYLPDPDAPGAYRIIFFLTAFTDDVYQCSAYFELK